jgi:diguanylate cyclase (GGDEF)-like protein/PAS domain S-box-containing protein
MLELHPDDLVGAPLTVLVVREDVERLSALVREAVQLGSVAEADLRLATAAAEQHVWTRTTVQSVVDAHGVAELHVTVRDITEQREAEERLARERQLLGVTLDNVSAGVLALDGYLRVIEANPVLADIIGFRPEIGTLVTDFAHRFQICRPDGTAFDLYERPLARAVGGELVVQLPALIVAEDGSVRHVIANAVPLEDVGQGRGGAVMTIHDVTALRHAEDELRRMALHDTLTGLANRHQLLRHLIDAFQRNARSPEELALLFIDLDGFKAVNDSLGHDAGDALLVAVGERLTSSVRVGDFVARYGGDEFVVVAERLADPVAASTLVSRLEVALAMPFELTQGTARIGGSIGVARMFEVDSPHMLLAQADAEMYERKRWRKRAGAPVS